MLHPVGHQDHRTKPDPVSHGNHSLSALKVEARGRVLQLRRLLARKRGVRDCGRLAGCTQDKQRATSSESIFEIYVDF